MNWDDFEVEQIKGFFHVVRQHKGANIGVCIAGDSALVLDSGYLPKRGAALRKIISDRLGCRIELLFNTHYHADHTFGNQSFECPILASTLCRKTMNDCLSTHWAPVEIEKAKEEDPELAEEWRDLSITLPTVTFERQRTYRFNGIKLVFRRAGGHTKDSSTAFFPDHGLLFSGDLVFSNIYPTLLTDGNPIELVRALKGLLDMNIDTIVPGHGATCDKRVPVNLIEYWECLVSRCRRLIASSQDDRGIRNSMLNRCLLPDMPFSEMKHARNIDSVVNFLRRTSAKAATGAKHEKKR